MKSIIQTEKECYVCGNKTVHLHHIYGGWANRRISDAHGFTVYLCPYHHNMSNEGVHFNRKLDGYLKRKCQRIYEQTHTREEFMNLIGRNYLDIEESENEDTGESQDRSDGDNEEGWVQGSPF